MNELLRVLQVEDSEIDASLIIWALENAGFRLETQRVENETQMRAGLDNGPWDLVLSDYRLPRFSAAAAIEVLQDAGLDIPVIVVSGSMNEDLKVQIIKGGAFDCILKDNLTGLPAAFDRAIKQARLHREAESNGHP